MRIFFLAIFLSFSGSTIAQQTVRDWFGVTSFLGGNKYGHAWPPENIFIESNVRRHFVALEYLSPVENVFWFNRSPIGWGWEDSLHEYAKNNTINIITLVGGFPWQTMDGKIGSRMPINIDADPLDENSYYALSRLCYNLAARWGNNSKAKINNNELAKETKPASGLGLVKYIEILNEWDNTWSGSSIKFNAASYAVCLKVCYDAIKSADPSMGIVMGGISRMDIPLIEQVMQEWEKRYGTFPRDIIINYHRYLHDGLAGGKRTKGLIPESGPFGAFNQIHEMNNLKRDWAITEFGWDADSTSLQRTPILKEADGVTNMSAEKSKGTLIVRSALIYATSSRCKMAVFYHIRNENNEGKGYLYASSGILYRSGPDYYATEAYEPVKEFLDTVGDFELPATLISSKPPYQVLFKKGKKKVLATWNDTSAVIYIEQ